MGKYLQNIEFRHDALVNKKGLLNEARELSPDLTIIESYFNKHLPKKIEIGNQIWRFIIMLTPIEEKNGQTEVMGLCQDYYSYVDYRKILALQSKEKQNILLDIFITGIKKCCEANNYPTDIFREIYEKVRDEMGTETMKD